MTAKDNPTLISLLLKSLQKKAVSLLSVREYGDNELRQKLSNTFKSKFKAITQDDWDKFMQSDTDTSKNYTKKFNSSVQGLIDYCLQECKDSDWQSNERYIESYIRVALIKGYGERKIRCILQKNCSATEIIDSCINLGNDKWQSLARFALEKKYGNDFKSDNYKEQAKRMRFLQARGFTQEQIWQIFR